MNRSAAETESRRIVLERIAAARARCESAARSGLEAPPPATAAPTDVPNPGSSVPSATPDPGERIERFARALERVQGVCHRATTDAGAAEALRSIIRDRDATRVVRSDDDSVITMLESVAGGFQLDGPDADRRVMLEADLGVSRASHGVAEYGTIVLPTGDAAGVHGRATERHRLVALLPEAHVAVLAASDLVDTWDQAMLESVLPDGELPPTITFATGPSRTADIELELVLGVHGPRAQHVVLLEHV
ncbi:MAG: lactate utilization protein [Planctomycetota bacterium]|nr:lactate utilization protein [Planctomycetota bacterium]